MFVCECSSDLLRVGQRRMDTNYWLAHFATYTQHSRQSTVTLHSGQGLSVLHIRALLLIRTLCLCARSYQIQYQTPSRENTDCNGAGHLYNTPPREYMNIIRTGHYIAIVTLSYILSCHLLGCSIQCIYVFLLVLKVIMSGRY